MSNAVAYKGYVASADFHRDDKVIVGRVLDIDDIVTFHGASVVRFERGFHAAVDGYIAACERIGRCPEKPASGRLMLRVAPRVHAAASKAAARSGTSLNQWAEKALEAAANRSPSDLSRACSR